MAKLKKSNPDMKRFLLCFGNVLCSGRHMAATDLEKEAAAR
jgi:hypothetical protein